MTKLSAARVSNQTTIGVVNTSCIPSLTAKDYETASRAQSTTTEYAKDLRYFIRDGGRLPSSVENVVAWLTAVATRLSPATIQRRLVSVNGWHRDSGHASPTTDKKVQRVFTGIRKVVGTKQRSVTPLVRDDLISVLAAVQRRNPVAASRDTALLLVGFSSALRRSNLVAIKVEHLTLHDHGMDIFLPRSKTDTSGKGDVVSIPFAVGDQCPVMATAHWLAISGIESGYLFRAVTKHHEVSSQKLDVGSIGRIFKRAVALSGRDSTTYSSHSARAGFVTSAAMFGMPAFQIAQISKHRGLSSLQRYMRIVEQRKIPSLL